MTKRIFDVVAAVAALAVLAPLMAIIAFLIKRDSSGPIIFKQQRVGLNGRMFNVLKFRSMLSEQDQDAPLITAADDARITRLGRVLRSGKLDELPQLLNIIRGDMSLVGPRPEVPSYVDMWTPRDRRAILSVRPGLTDPITLRLRGEELILASIESKEEFYTAELLPRKTAAYVEYASAHSFIGDLKILVMTLIHVLRG